ncbi:MAG TPA: hypothetical protein DIS74_11255 [Bacteroidales bacterium]|nr:hypothetical protein [Bacteroidales bacterium]
MRRRKFIVSAAAAVPAITLFPSDLSGITRESVRGKLEKRSLGKTGEMLSVIGFGGIVVMNATPDDASARVKIAVGILPLKAMAKGPWPEGADRSAYPKCWYEPLVNEEDIAIGLRFSLSHPVTAAIPPGDKTLFRHALKIAVADKLKPLDKSEMASIREKALKGVPLFKS